MEKPETMEGASYTLAGTLTDLPPRLPELKAYPLKAEKTDEEKKMPEPETVKINGYEFMVGDRVGMSREGEEFFGTVRCVHPTGERPGLCVDRDDGLRGIGCEGSWSIGKLMHGYIHPVSEERGKKVLELPSEPEPSDTTSEECAVVAQNKALWREEVEDLLKVLHPEKPDLYAWVILCDFVDRWKDKKGAFIPCFVDLPESVRAAPDPCPACRRAIDKLKALPKHDPDRCEHGWSVGLACPDCPGGRAEAQE